MNDTDDYLTRNRRIARQFLGHRLRSVVRLMTVEPQDKPRFEWGGALIELDTGRSYLIECEESKSNVILFEMTEQLQRLHARDTVRPPIVRATSDDPLRFMLEQPIVGVDAISRAPDPDPSVPRRFEMCGLQLRFANGDRVCIGTHLTEDLFVTNAFYLPMELDSTLRYAPIEYDE